MSHRALIVWGGWSGHEPQPVAEIIAEQLSAKGFEVEISDTLDAFKDAEKLSSLDLVVPVWTMGKITGEQLNPVAAAVRAEAGYRRMPRRHVQLVPRRDGVAVYDRRPVGSPPLAIRVSPTP